MKIVVYDLGNNSFRWRIDNGNGILCFCSTVYSRKSDAKRGAERFETKLWEHYKDCESDRYGLPVEVID